MLNEGIAFAQSSLNGNRNGSGLELTRRGWDQATILRWLQARGEEQEQLFAAARAARERVFGRRVLVRGLIEVTNLCRVNCEFCPMRRDNTKQNTIFQLTEDQILEAVDRIKAAGINIVFFQAGEVGKTTRLIGGLLPKIRARFGGPVELLLCLGNKSDADYQYLRAQGANSYILKHETSDADLNARMRRSPFSERIGCLQTLIRLGYKVGTGAIIGLPGQSLESLASDLDLARDLGAHMVSGSPFIPAPDTPLADHPPGDVDLTLNFIAIARIMNPAWLIPSVSALERRTSGGQLSGLAAGANVLTVNFTPPAEQERYLIYGKDRYVVRNDHVTEIVREAGLERGESVFAA